MSVVAGNRVRLASQYKVPVKVIPDGLTQRSLEPRISAFEQKGRRWLLEQGVGQSILASGNFATDFGASMEKVDRLISGLQCFGFAGEDLRQAVIKTMAAKLLQAPYLANLSSAAYLASKLDLPAAARQQINGMMQGFIFDSQAGKSFNRLAYQMLKVAESSFVLESIPGLFKGIKQDLVKANLYALDRMARILLVDEQELDARFKAFSLICVEHKAKQIYPIKSLDAFKYVCVEFSQASLQTKLEELVGRYGFTQEVFDANQELMYVTLDKISPSYAATAFIQAAKAAVKNDQLEQALELAKKAQSFKGNKLCHRVANVVDYFPEALEKLMAAQKLLDFEAIRDLLRDAYQLCLRSERKNTIGSESRYCEPIIQRIKLLMADAYLSHFRQQAAKGDKAAAYLVMLLDQWEAPLKEQGVFHYFMLLCVMRQLETMYVPDSAKTILNKFAEEVLEILDRAGKANKGQLERILKQQSLISVVGNVMLGILAVGRPFYANRLDISLLTLAKWLADGRPNSKNKVPKKTLKKDPPKNDPPKTEDPKIALNLSQFIQNINRAKILAMSLDDVTNIKMRIICANRIFELLHYTREDVARFFGENMKIRTYLLLAAQLRSQTVDLIYGFGGIDASHPDLSDQLRAHLLKYARNDN